MSYAPSVVGSVMGTQVPFGEGLVALAAGSTGQSSAPLHPPPGMASAAGTHLSHGLTLSQGSADSVTDGVESLNTQVDDSESRSSSRTLMVLAEAAVGHPSSASLCPILLPVPLSTGLDRKVTS